jgi:hypothetical protein
MIGLYYPFIHFRDENWLKLALIYWSKVARIVPESYKTHDSGEVCRVQDELDAVINCSPKPAFDAVAHFIKFIERNATRLRKRYDIRRSSSWKIDKYTRAHAPPGTDPRFAFIYGEKMAEELANVLLHEGLAVQGEGIGPTIDWRWVGVHPAIAAVYMTSIAEAIAGQSGYRLLADDLASHLVVGEQSVDRLAELLLRDGSPAKPKNLIGNEAVALFALRTVLPKDISTIPMKQIIQLRKKYPAELADFQAWVHTTTKALTEITGGVSSPSAMKEHLTVLEEQQIKPRLAALKRLLNSLAIETVTGAMSVKSPWNITGTTAALYLSQPWLAAGGVAISAIPNIGKQRREAQRTISGNHAAYLLHVQEHLTPRKLTDRIGRKWRKLSIGV